MASFIERCMVAEATGMVVSRWESEASLRNCLCARNSIRWARKTVSVNLLFWCRNRGRILRWYTVGRGCKAQRSTEARRHQEDESVNEGMKPTKYRRCNDVGPSLLPLRPWAKFSSCAWSGRQSLLNLSAHDVPRSKYLKVHGTNLVFSHWYHSMPNATASVEETGSIETWNHSLSPAFFFRSAGLSFFFRHSRAFGNNPRDKNHCKTCCLCFTLCRPSGVCMSTKKIWNSS